MPWIKPAAIHCRENCNYFVDFSQYVCVWSTDQPTSQSVVALLLGCVPLRERHKQNKEEKNKKKKKRNEKSQKWNLIAQPEIKADIKVKYRLP